MLLSDVVDTWLFPLVQMGQLGVEHDAEVTTRILSDAPSGSSICMATGYFNLTQQYVNTIIKESAAQFNVLMAHPDVSKFNNNAHIILYDYSQILKLKHIVIKTDLFGSVVSNLVF